VSDCCYLEVTVRSDDAERAVECLGEPDSRCPEGVSAVVFVYESANYGLNLALTELAGRGVEFVGWHSPGSDYNPTQFYTRGRILDYLEMGHDNFGYIVFGSNAQERRANLAEVEARIEAREALESAIKNPLYDMVKHNGLSPR
jgi:hypothetical protein